MSRSRSAAPPTAARTAGSSRPWRRSSTEALPSSASARSMTRSGPISPGEYSVGTPARAARIAMPSASADFPLPTSPAQDRRDPAGGSRRPACGRARGSRSAPCRARCEPGVDRVEPGHHGSSGEPPPSPRARITSRSARSSGPRRPRRLRHRLARLRPTGLPGGRHQLAQHLGRGLRAHVAQLADGRDQRAPERRRQGEAREPMLQGLQPAAVGPLGGGGSRTRSCATRRVSQSAKIPSRLRPPSGLGQQREQRARRRDPSRSSQTPPWPARRRPGRAASAHAPVMARAGSGRCLRAAGPAGKIQLDHAGVGA